MLTEAARPLEPGRAGLRGDQGHVGGGKRGWSGRRWLPYMMVGERESQRIGSYLLIGTDLWGFIF